MTSEVTDYLKNHTLEEVTRDWEEVNRKEEPANNYDDWIKYHERKEKGYRFEKPKDVHGVILNVALFLIMEIDDFNHERLRGSKFGLTDEQFEILTGFSSDEVSFKLFKETVYNGIFNDKGWLALAYPKLKVGERKEKFIEDREKNYLI